MEKLVIIDGNSLLFRAYFAMRPMVTKDGVYTQGIYSFINMLNKILSDHEPDYLAVAFDMKAKTFRHEFYPEYKAGRQQTPIELLSEIPILHRVLKAMNIAVMEKETYEADDIIGTVTKAASERGIQSFIITGDKDELQLVDANTSVVINKKGASEFDVYDTDKMNERYGLTPLQFIDLKGLMGDKSDNIPGIRGVGEKKGLALLGDYGSLENVLDHADEIKGKLGENVRASKDVAVLSKKLATIKRDVPVDVDFDTIRFIEPDAVKLIDIYKELEFNTFIVKLGSKEDEVADIVGNMAEDFSKKAAEIKDADWEEFFAGVESDDKLIMEVVTDNSHMHVPSIYGIGAYSPRTEAFTYRQVTLLDAEQAVAVLGSTPARMIGHDLKHSLYAMTEYGVDHAELHHDTEIAEYLIDPNKSKYSVKKMLLKYCSCVQDEDSDYVNEDGAVDTKRLREYLFAIWKISVEQEKMMEKEGLLKLFRNCEMPLIETMVSMERCGMSVRPEVLKDQGLELDRKISVLEKSILEAAGEDFNINSPKQLGTVLFEDMEIPYPKGSKGKKNYSTSADILEKLKGEYKIVEEVLEYRKYTKLKSTYIDGLLALIADDGRIHTHFNQTVAATGRISCTEPNLQNIPIRDEYGRNIRRAFVPSDETMIFIGADYSQIELRILAALSGDEVFIDAFNRGEDIHRLTASRVFDMPIEDVKPIDRSRAKAVNFGVVYGMSGFGLSEELGVSRFEAQKYIDEYFEKHTAVKAYLDKQVETGKTEHQVKTMFGRIRQIPEFSSRKYQDRQLAIRLAMNTPIQGTAADIIKLAMNKVYYELKERGMKSRLILQIHDELIIEASIDEIDEVKELLKRDMEGAAKLDVALECDINSGSSWYDLK